MYQKDNSLEGDNSTHANEDGNMGVAGTPHEETRQRKSQLSMVPHEQSDLSRTIHAGNGNAASLASGRKRAARLSARW